MTIMEGRVPEEGKIKEGANNTDNTSGDTPKQDTDKEAGTTAVFVKDELVNNTVVKGLDISSGSLFNSKVNTKLPIQLTITPEDKVAFLDSIVTNTRFEKEYSLFNGRVTIKLRSLTSEELQAMSAWVLKHSISKPEDQMSGRYMKYLMTAMVSSFNNVDIEPLAQPLFETVGKDGKVVEPGWLAQGAFWDDKGVGVMQMVKSKMDEFDMLYSTLCSKAEDENFWKPDTP